MRALISAVLLTFCPVALGWSVTLYSDYDCNDAARNDFSYYIFEGKGAMTDCMHAAADKNFPVGVTCRYYDNGGKNYEKCKGQLSEIESWVVTEGEASFWGNWIEATEQDPAHCANPLNHFPKGGSKFGPQGCRNAYYDYFGRGFFPFKGFKAWD